MMPQSNTGAHKKYVQGKMGYFLFFQPWSKTGAEPGDEKSRYGANGLFFIIFCPSSKLGQDRSTLK